MAGALAKIGPKFQVTIPKDVREQFQLEIGGYVEVLAAGDVITLRPKVLVDRPTPIEGMVAKAPPRRGRESAERKR